MRSSALSAEAAAADADQMAGPWPARPAANFPAAERFSATFPERNSVIRPAAHVDIVVPVTTHQRDLELMIIRLHSFLAAEFPFAAQVTIATAGPSERTWTTARRLAGLFAEVSAVRTGATSRGPALRAVWAGSDADVLAYLDPDLSIDLAALLPLIEPLVAGTADVAVGTRLEPGAGPQRRARREVTSCGYSLLLQAGLDTGLADAQCGFKAITRDCARDLLPLTSDGNWFFDSELIALARRAGLRVHEVAVNEPAGPGRSPGPGHSAGRPGTRRNQAARRLGEPLTAFAAIGLASTLVYAACFLALRQVMPVQAANAASLLVTAVANTAANRRFTFGIGGRAAALRHQLRGLIAFAAGLALTAGSLAILQAADHQAGRGSELAVVIAASSAAMLLRFGLYSNWVFEGNAA
jgi:putative flippase GtrA